ncbi:unnamed protein product [Prorocentrum cordatum]|uniref:RanBP2-type domain-containing protein n=1 Tax=Prorocentrum cordatum TaxID=2364126 RepID=A0ABN9XL23_9DINO|nr:unnamed protein product [Polarella glacialis]
MLDAFLRQQPRQGGGQCPPAAGGVGGALYARFRRWLPEALAGEGAGGEDPATEALLRRLRDFALGHFGARAARRGALGEEAEAPPAQGRPPSAGPSDAMAAAMAGNPFGSSWRCERCTTNTGSAAHCTACLKARSRG